MDTEPDLCASVVTKQVSENMNLTKSMVIETTVETQKFIDDQFVDFIEQKLINLKKRITDIVEESVVEDKYKDFFSERVGQLITYLLAPSPSCGDVPNIIMITHMLLTKYYDDDGDSFDVDSLISDQLSDAVIVLQALSNHKCDETNEIVVNMELILDAFNDDANTELIDACKIIACPYFKMFCALYLSSDK